MHSLSLSLSPPHTHTCMQTKIIPTFILPNTSTKKLIHIFKTCKEQQHIFKIKKSKHMKEQITTLFTCSHWQYPKEVLSI